MSDHIHLCLCIPPRYSAINPIGFVKGKSAIRIYRACLGQQRTFTKLHFRAKECCVSTFGLDVRTIVRYIRNQEAEEEHLEQLQIRGL